VCCTLRDPPFHQRKLKCITSTTASETMIASVLGAENSPRRVGSDRISKLRCTVTDTVEVGSDVSTQAFCKFRGDNIQCTSEHHAHKSVFRSLRTRGIRLDPTFELDSMVCA
jgi:hypothetical protein